MTKFKRLFALLVAIVLCMSLLTLTACPGPEEKPDASYVADPETRPLTMSIQNPDGVFNPFFSTSAMDSSIISMTQIGMLSSTKDGKPKCGEDEPVAVKSYKIEEVVENGRTYTDYSFIIKNGIKFSDGTPLTIKDILFNLYVYLDPVYTGSSTIYSTDIVGLQAYRQQDPDANADDASAFEDGFILAAMRRITEIVEFVRAFGIYNPPTGVARPDPSNYSDDQILAFWKNVAFAGKEFRKELESDWNNASVESYKDEGFTEKWQVFLSQDARIDFYQKDQTGKYIKDEKGNMQVDPEIIELYANALDADLARLNQSKTDENIRNWAINSAYEKYFGIAVNTDTGVYDPKVFDATDLTTIEELLSDINATNFAEVVNSWMTADTILTQLVADLKAEHFGNEGHPVKTISGITSSAAELKKVTVDFDGKDLGEPHDILKIRINNIDPKAIWNFSFNIAPLHYYSGKFAQDGIDYYETFNAAEGQFGFAFGNKDFFDEVINAPNKVGLPLGAGVYMASTVNGGRATSGSQFSSGNIIYYERNPYFDTLGEGISNAKIKYFRYKVVESDQIVNSLTNGDIDIGEPNATPEIEKWLDSHGVEHDRVLTAGYGYVGINPRFVPDVTVRRAIMKAMNRQDIQDNYYQNLCEIINRPMSRASWAFPEGATVYSTTYTDKNGQEQTVTYDYVPGGNTVDGYVVGLEIEQLLESVGYVKGTDGIYSRNIPGLGEHRLSYKFTIAGSSTDHPAYAMFVQAQNILNRHGFDIKVVTSQQALSDLSAGKLAVWAAAWSSTIDPDMYQVYHKDSNASSVNNWGYPQIKANGTVYGFEQGIIEELSTLIERGRETNTERVRKNIYSDALDLVMELAVELPTYQRNDLTAFNGNLLDRNTMTAKEDLTPYNGLISRIWELNYIFK